jgi:hypothetical protein
MSQLKPQSTLTNDAPFDSGTIAEDHKKVVVDVQGARLKAMLNAMRK